VLGTSLTRNTVLKAASVVAAAGLAALGGPHPDAAAKNKKKKKLRDTPNHCPQDKKNAVCLPTRTGRRQLQDRLRGHRRRPRQSRVRLHVRRQG
jgi:hypothetical protein